MSKKNDGGERGNGGIFSNTTAQGHEEVAAAVAVAAKDSRCTPAQRIEEPEVHVR